MIGWIIAGLTFLVTVGVAIYLFFFQHKGQKVMLELYEIRHGKFKRIKPDKLLFGYETQENNLNMLKVPQSISKTPIKSADTESYIDTDRSYPIVRLLRASEGNCHVLKAEYNLESKQFTSSIDYKGLLQWYIRHTERDEKELGEKASIWSQIAPYVSFAMIAVVAILAMYYTSGHFQEESAKSAVKLRQDLNNQANFINDVLRYCNEGGEVPKFTNTTADRPLTNNTG